MQLHERQTQLPTLYCWLIAPGATGLQQVIFFWSVLAFCSGLDHGRERWSGGVSFRLQTYHQLKLVADGASAEADETERQVVKNPFEQSSIPRAERKAGWANLKEKGKAESGVPTKTFALPPRNRGGLRKD